VGGQHPAEHGRGGESAGGIDQRSEKAGMQESGILSGILAPGHRDRRAAGLGGNDFDSAPAVERCRGVDGPQASQCVGRWLHDRAPK